MVRSFNIAMVLVILSSCLMYSQIHENNDAMAKAAAKEYLLQRAKACGADSATVEIRVLPDAKYLNQPGTSIRLIEDGTLSPRGTCSVPFELIRGEKSIGRFFISTRVRTFGSVLLVTAQLPAGSLIEGKDCEMHWMETTGMPADVITQIADIVSMQTTRIVNAGTVLTKSILRRVPVVKPDALVTLIVRSGNVALSARAIAKDAGGVNDIILVQRFGTHDRVHARILDAKTVEMVTEF